MTEPRGTEGKPSSGASSTGARPNATLWIALAACALATSLEMGACSDDATGSSGTKGTTGPGGSGGSGGSSASSGSSSSSGSTTGDPPACGREDVAGPSCAGPNSSPPVCSKDGFCWASPRPTGLDYHAVWGTSPSNIWAGGERGKLLHGDGDHFLVIDAGVDFEIQGIWGTGPDDVWVVGDDGGVSSSSLHYFDYAVHWDGTAWTPLVRPGNPPQKLELEAVWGSSSKDVWFAGRRRTMVHVVDGAWSEVDLPGAETPQIRSISGSGPDDVWAVGEGSNDGLVFHFDGLAWSLVDVGFPLPDRLERVLAFSITEAWAAGQQGLFLHYDGASWSQIPLTDTNTFTGLWGPSGKDLWLGSNGHLQHWDGSALGPELDATATVGALWGSCDEDIWGVGDTGMLMHWDGKAWSDRAEAPTRSTLRKAWASAADDAWAVGGRSILRWQGATWCPVDAPDVPYTAVWGSGAKDVWFFGQGDSAVHWDGTKLDSVPLGTSGASFMDAWGAGGEVFAVGNEGLIVRWNGSAWSTMSSGTTSDLWAVWAAAPNDVWAGALDGGTFHYDGASWSPRPAAGSSQLVDLFGVGGEVYAGTLSDGLLRWSGSAWDPVPGAGFGGSVDAIWGASKDDLFIATSDAIDGLLHFDGNGWSDVSVGTRLPLDAMTGSGSHLFIVARNGIILQK